MVLGILGHTTFNAHDGPTAVESVRRFRPDFAFLDIGLPGMDGYEVCRQVLANPSRRGTTLVALTGWGAEEDRRRTRNTGFAFHQVKPVDPDEVAALLREASERRGKTAEPSGG